VGFLLFWETGTGAEVRTPRGMTGRFSNCGYERQLGIRTIMTKVPTAPPL